MHSKTRIFLIIASTFALCAVLVFAYFFYQVLNAGQLLAERVEVIAQMNATLKTNTELSSLIEETEAQRAQLSELILTEEGTSVFLTEVEAMAQRVGVSLSTRSLKVIEQEDLSYNLLQLELEISGRDDLVIRMLNVLEVLQYHSRMEKLIVNNDATGGTEAIVELMVTLQK